MKKLFKITMLVGLVFSFINSASALEWVYGDVDRIDEFSAYDTFFVPGSNNGGWYPDPRPYGILFKLTNKRFDLGANSQASLNCTDRFRLVEGEQGMTAETRKRIYAMMLTAYATGTRVGFYVDTTPSNTGMCTIMAAIAGKNL